MAARVNHRVKVTPKAKKSEVNDYLENLQNLPQHKWIPIEDILGSSEAFCTPRQAIWMEDQVGKQVEGATVALEPLPEPAESA